MKIMNKNLNTKLEELNGFQAIDTNVALTEIRSQLHEVSFFLYNNSEYKITYSNLARKLRPIFSVDEICWELSQRGLRGQAGYADCEERNRLGPGMINNAVFNLFLHN